MSEGYNTPEEAIAAGIEEGGVEEFDGKNCEDTGEDGTYCSGWDGVSRRCDCGNRRVGWETGQYSNGKFYAYGQAW